MSKPYINLPLNLLLISAVLFAGNGFAGREDFKKEVKIDAAKQFADGKRRVSVFMGDVEIIQGSLNIKADEVETDASRGDGKEVLIARGKPASYSQTTDDGSTIKAVAKEIRYDVSTRILTLTGGAEVTQDTSMVKGESITYNMEQEQLVAESSSDNSDRVTTIFRPGSTNKDEVESTSEQSQEQP